MKVKNLIGSSDNTCFCDSWFDHWKIYNDGGKKFQLWCSAEDCKGIAEAFDIGDTPLASANVAETCGWRRW